MKEVKILVKRLIDGICTRELAISDVKSIIEESSVSKIYKIYLLDLIGGITDDVGVLHELCNYYGSIRHKCVGLFEKVSSDIFLDSTCGNSLFSNLLKEDILGLYENIILPKRSTSGSAGYDFVTPVNIVLNPGESVLVPTGIRACMLENWVLNVYPRSGLGTKYRIQLDNTVGVIDSDYYFSDNEGHIMIKITNDSKEGKTLNLGAGERFCQGVFMEYGVIFGDDVTTVRNGGFGSTSK